MVTETGRFRRSDRLLDSRDFRRVLRQGDRRADRDLVVFSAGRSEKSIRDRDLSLLGPDGVRLGITASRKFGNAVARNRFKRRVRAWFRTRRAGFPPGRDLIVIARPSAAGLSFDELDRKLSRLVGRAGSEDQRR